MSKALTNDVPAAGAAALIADLAREASKPEIVFIPTDGLGDGLPDKLPILFDRNGQKVISLKDEIERARLLPQRRRGTAKAETLASFAALVNRHKSADSAIFAATSWPKPSLTAVIDYHTLAHEPRHAQHRIVYDFPLTDEFKAWIAGNGKLQPQLDFAQFIEEHAAELAAPLDAERNEYERLFKERFATPAELIDLSRHLEVYIGAKVKRAERLASGERTIEFTSENLNAKGEKIDVPGVFMVSVPAFVDGEAVRIPARLRYRAAAGEVLWAYQLYRWEFWLRAQVQSDMRWATKETDLPAYEGAPETSEPSA